MDLKTKLAFALVSASLFSMAALAYFTHLAAADLFLDDARRQLDALAESRKKEIDPIFETWRGQVAQIIDDIDAHTLTVREFETRSATTMQQIDEVLRDATDLDPDVRSAMLFDARGEVVLETRKKGVGPASATTRDGSDTVRLVTERDGRRSVSIRQGWSRGEKRMGSVEVTFDASSIGRFIGSTASLGETGETRLLIPLSKVTDTSDAGPDRLLALSSLGAARPGGQSDRDFAETPPTISAALAQGKHASATFTDEAGVEVSAAAFALDVPGWGLMVSAHNAEARNRADRLITDLRDLGVALAAFATLGGVLLGLRMGKPIYELKEQVDRIRHGELGLRLEVKGEDEVSFLAQSLNEFIAQLDRSSDLFRVGGLRVLVVQPDERVRQLLGDLLQKWGMHPDLVESGSRALEVLQEASKSERALQMVLIDDAITDVDPVLLAKQLRTSRLGPIPVIALASKLEGPVAEGLKASGVETLLPKPVVASHLMEAILDEMGIAADDVMPATDTLLTRTTPRKILLAEDNQLMQQVMLGFLENWGHEVQLAENGRMAVEACQRESFDLVLMDVMMPEMNGLEATVAIRNNERPGGRRTPIIALTAEALDGDRESCLTAGMDDYLTKPVDPKELYARIDRVPSGMASTTERDEPAEDHNAALEPAVPPIAAASTGNRASAGDGASDEDGASAEDRAGPLDWEQARTFTNDDDALLDELLDAYPDETRQQVAAIRTAVETGDVELLVRSAHSLKGAAKILGAAALADAAFAIEALGREGRADPAPALLDNLEREAQRFIVAIEQQIGR